MQNINLKKIVDSPKESLIEDINGIFNSLVQEIKSYLNLNPIKQLIKVQYNLNEIPQEKLDDEPFNIGVKRIHEEKLITITFFKYYDKFIHPLILKEAFRCFIPYNLENNDIVNIFILKLIEKFLSKNPIIEEWKAFIRENVLDISPHLTQITNFLKLESEEVEQTPIRFFFEYVSRNVFQIEDMKEDFFTTLTKEYWFNTSKSMKNDDIIETIRILILIFYNVKRYRAFIDYKDYFKKFKEKKIINTPLSLRKFVKNTLWIKKFTQIAPSYQINWVALNVYPIISLIRFNPQCNNEQVFKILDHFPFLVNSRYSINNFGLEIFGISLVPKPYLKDFNTFLGKLETYGIIENRCCMKAISTNTYLNLNYFREFSKEGQIIDSIADFYDKKFEIKFTLSYLGSSIKEEKKLSLFDWLLIERINLWVNILGVGFEKGAEVLRTLKTDLFNEIINQRKIIEDLKFNLQNLKEKPQLIYELLELLNINKSFGFFYIREYLSALILYLNLLLKDYLENPHSSMNSFITKFSRFKKSFTSLDDKYQHFEKKAEKIIVKKYIPIIFKSVDLFNREFEKFKNFTLIFDLCYDLKIFDIDSIIKLIQHPHLIGSIYKIKKDQLQKEYENYQTSQITIKQIDKRINSFLNNTPPIIIPSLISTILTSSFARYYPHLILKDTVEVREVIDKIRSIFPRTLVISSHDLFTNSSYIFLWIYLPNLEIKEKKLLFSILYNIFGENIKISRRFFYGGLLDTYSRKDFYDLTNHIFFYTPHLFKDVFRYIKKITRNNISRDNQVQKIKQIKKNFWIKNKTISDLIKVIEERKSKENIDYNIQSLKKLCNFHQDLRAFLLTYKEKYEISSEYFFYNYVKSIKFKVAYQAFGFSGYTLFIYPFNLNEIDFKLFLTNSFQKLKFHVNISDSNSFLINYIFPYRNPNKSYLNWLTKSKKNIREYCLFTSKKLYQILHFDYNLTSKGWDYYPNRFKNHAENILFNPTYKDSPLNLKEFSMSRSTISEMYGPNSGEYEIITSIQGQNTSDLNFYLDPEDKTKIDAFKYLLEKNLIFPYISLKNLELLEKVRIILPVIKPSSFDSLIKIFSFFNFSFIYEIEGEYFIYGFDEEVKFGNGLMIELNLPDCELHEFIKIFDLIFYYFEIDHYLILTDMVDSYEFLESIYGSLDFLKSYNPLKNLIWNKKDRIWMNHKLFNEQFEPQYPELLPDEIKEK